MSLDDAFYAILFIAGLIVFGKWIRRKWTLLQNLFLPSSIVAGFLALLLGPQILGRLGSDDFNGLWSENILAAWGSLPGLLISVVFAALFLGKTLPNPKEIWEKAGPMVAHGQTLAWGQYVVGLLLAWLVLVPFFDSSPLAGALIEIGFEGGHGTAAGLGDTFKELGFADGADLALGLATIGVVAGVLLGTLFINWAVWRGHLKKPGQTTEEKEELAEHESREPTPEEAFKDKAIEPLSFHFGLVAIAIGLGWLLLEGMIQAEARFLVPLGWPELLRHIPLFPLAMIGGVMVQIAAQRLGFAFLINRALINRIAGTSLDILIVSALGALSLEAIGTNIGPFLLLAAAGIVWNCFGFLVLARVFFRKNWVANGLANFGQGMGMTVIGLLLVRMSDPRNRTGAMEAFGYKQLLFEPVVGGGLFTAASLPLIYQFGPVPVLIGVTVVMFGWLFFGWWMFYRKASA